MEKQELQKLSTSSKSLTHSSSLNTAVRLIETKTAIQAISDALLRIGTLYQIPNFSEANALILAEWTADNYKHKTLELILDALKNPAIIYEDGNVTRSWRLTPETVAIWIEKRSTEQETKRQLEETRKAHDKLLPQKSGLSHEGQQMIADYIKELGNGMFQTKKPVIQSERAKQIDLLLKLLAQYRKESFDPITGNLKEGSYDEREWLLNKGYFIENSELKEL